MKTKEEPNGNFQTEKNLITEKIKNKNTHQKHSTSGWRKLRKELVN